MVVSTSQRYRGWRVTASFLAGLSAMMIGGFLSIGYFFISGFGECKAVVQDSISSPDGKKSIVIFRNECGETVGYNTQASIASAGNASSPEKNPAFFVVSGTPYIMAKWLGDKAVEINVAIGDGKVFKSDPNVGDIKVEYR
jgi:hypothetical protein